MNCNEVQSLLSEYIDHYCTDKQNIEIAHHLEICSECAKEYHMLQDMISSLNDIEEINPPEDLHSLIMTRIDTIEQKKKSTPKIPFQSFSLVAAAFLLIIVFAVIGKFDFLFPIDEGADHTKQEISILQDAAQAPQAKMEIESTENSSFMLDEADIPAEADAIPEENISRNKEAISDEGERAGEEESGGMEEKDADMFAVRLMEPEEKNPHENLYYLLFGIGGIAIIFLFSYVMRKKNG